MSVAASSKSEAVIQTVDLTDDTGKAGSQSVNQVDSASEDTGNARSLSKSQKRKLRQRLARTNFASTSAGESSSAQPKLVLQPQGEVAKGTPKGGSLTAPNQANKTSEVDVRKRKPGKDGTPQESNSAKRPNNEVSMKQNEGFAEMVIESYLVMAIMHMPRPNKIIILVLETMQTIFKAVNALMLDDLRSGVQMPTFNETRLKRGVFQIVCTDQMARSWLENSISRISARVGILLAICEFSKIPRQSLILAFFPHCDYENDEIRSMLKACNPSLPDIEWTVSNRKVVPTGVQLLLKVDASTRNSLFCKEGSLHFGLGCARFRVILPKAKKPKAPVNQEEMMSIANDSSESEFDEQDLAQLTLSDSPMSDAEVDSEMKRGKPKAKPAEGIPSKSTDRSKHEHVSAETVLNVTSTSESVEAANEQHSVASNISTPVGAATVQLTPGETQTAGAGTGNSAKQAPNAVV